MWPFRPSPFLRRFLALAFVLVLTGLALLIPDALVFSIRKTLVAGLVLAGSGAAVAAFLIRQRWLAPIFVAIVALVLWQAVGPALDRRDVLGRKGQDVAELGRHFIIGYDDPAAIAELVREGRIGGIFLTRRNVIGRSLESVAAEVAGLQDIRRAAGLPLLIVAADQEGGPVSHLSPPLPVPPALATIVALPPEQRRQAAWRLGKEQGDALKAIGVTMDLAPVSDLTPAGAPGFLDWHSLIATRSISPDPVITAIVATGFSEGLLAAGVMPTAKHFPGLGRVATDTHLFRASLGTPVAELQGSDWVPFQAVLGTQGAAVMLSHVALADLDAARPASQSRLVVADLLRRQWGFAGLAITDDLSMGAAQQAGLCQAVENGLNAGIDLLLVSYDLDKAYPVLRCALDAKQAGRLDETMLRESAERLRRFGEKPNLP